MQVALSKQVGVSSHASPTGRASSKADVDVELAPDFDDWYRRAHPAVLRALVLFTGDPDRSHDLAAEAFLLPFRRWATGARPDDPTGWVYVVAMNSARRRDRSPVVLRRVEWLTDRPAEQPHPDRDLLDAVAALPSRQRAAIALRYGADLTEAEVARVMKVAPGTVAATLSNARSNLQRTLRDMGRDDGR